MFQVGIDWNPLQAQLKELLISEDSFEKAKELLLHMHGLVHPATVSSSPALTFFDEVWQGLDRTSFITMPTVKDVTVAWNIWHITRIEDLTVNLLIAEGAQVLNDDRHTLLNTKVTDTGNAMTDDEILSLSGELNMQALYDYRCAVGEQTRRVLQGLQFEDLKRRVTKSGTDRILSEGGVTPHKDSVWLLDFWGKKTIAGLLQMPVTRHQVGHLNDCVKLKGKCARLKRTE